MRLNLLPFPFPPPPPPITNNPSTHPAAPSGFTNPQTQNWSASYGTIKITITKIKTPLNARTLGFFFLERIRTHTPGESNFLRNARTCLLCSSTSSYLTLRIKQFGLLSTREIQRKQRKRDGEKKIGGYIQIHMSLRVYRSRCFTEQKHLIEVNYNAENHGNLQLQERPLILCCRQKARVTPLERWGEQNGLFYSKKQCKKNVARRKNCGKRRKNS